MPWLDAAEASLTTWASVLSYSCLALLVAWVTMRIVLGLALRTSQGFPVSNRVIQRVRRPALLIFPLLVMHGVLHAADDGLRLMAAARQTSLVLLIIVVTWLLVRAISGVADGLLSRYPMGADNNLEARRMYTQTRVLSRSLMSMVAVIGLAAVLMSFPNVRQIGASLLASAGVAGLIAGIAARPVIGNFIAGLQIALTQPIRIDDVLVINGEWGRVEEISNAYVILKIWDERRLVIPLQWFIENPFQNWTRHNAELIGSVFLWVDYRMPLAPLREHAKHLCESAPEWDGRLCLLQVIEAGDRAVQVRVLVTAANSNATWDLRCKVREGLVDFMQREYPQFLPRLRTDSGHTGPHSHALNATALDPHA